MGATAWRVPYSNILKQSLPCPCTQNFQSNLLFSYTMAEGEKMHSKLPGSLFLSRNRQPKKPTIFWKLAAFNRKLTQEERQNWGNIRDFKNKNRNAMKKNNQDKKEALDIKNIIAEKILNKKAGRYSWGNLPKAKWKERDTQRERQKEGRERKGERWENIRGTDNQSMRSTIWWTEVPERIGNMKGKILSKK